MSLWVRRRAKGFDRFLGVSCAGYEERILDLLLGIEKGRKSAGCNSSDKKKKARVSSSRELKNLCCNLNFDRSDKKGGEGRRTKILNQ